MVNAVTPTSVRSVKMAGLHEASSKAVIVTLHPLKGVNILKERYTEDTADVFFVGKETKERLPAHREVLKVASAVFFKMFNGDWKEKQEKEIPAPEEYNWESFKAAITLLYGEEVQIKESSIVDVYRVAHCYDLKDVVYALVRDIHQWDCSMAATMIELGVIVGELETDRDQMQEDLFQVVMPYLARNLEVITSESLFGLSYDEMLMLVQVEDIKISEVELLSRLNQWIKHHPDLTLVQAEKLLSHIRFGTIPYETLVACEVGHKNRSLALKHYNQPIELVRENIVQVTPRSSQKDIFQVFPVTAGLSVWRHGDTWTSSYTTSTPSVGVVYFGREEVRFEGSIIRLNRKPCNLICEVTNIFGTSNSVRKIENLNETQNFNGTHQDILYRHFSVILNQTGAHFVLQCTKSPLSLSRTITKPLELPFSGPFPLLLTFGMADMHSFTFTYPTHV